MNRTYFNFLFINTIKRRPVYLMWAFYLLLIIVMLILLPIGTKTAPLFFWCNPLIFSSQSYFILVGAILTATLVVYIFMSTRDEGTDLVVISKRISKRSMVLIKLLVFASILMLINLSALLITCFVFCLPSLDKAHYGWLILSMFVGDLINLFVFGSIALILSTIMSKAALIVANTIIALGLFIYQVICAFVITTPLTSLTKQNITPHSYIYLDRDTDGSYKEKNLVDFIPSVSSGGAFENFDKWYHVYDFWNNSKTPVKNSAINWTNIISQLDSAYIQGSIQEYADELATRQFGVSRYYDYELTSPASPEITNKPESMNQSLKWIYTGQRWITVKSKSYGNFEGWIPEGYGFPAVSTASAMDSLGHFYKTVPVGSYHNSINNTNFIVNFEQNDYAQYKDGFNHMYNLVFRHDLIDKDGNNLYDLSNINQYDYLSAWSLKNENLAKYYDLIWYCLTGNASSYLNQDQNGTKLSDLLPESKDYYNIKSIDDLNIRFIQFKYYIFELAQKEQQDVIEYKIKPSDKEIAARNKAEQALTHTANRMGIDWSKDNWYMTTKSQGELPFTFLGWNNRSVAYHLLIEMLKSDYQIPGESDYDLINCSYAKITKCSTIFNKCINFKEPFMFNTLDINQSQKRSPEYTGYVYNMSQPWIPEIAGRFSHYAQNMNLFFYEIKQTTPFWAYWIVWIGLSSILIGCTGYIYYKYDIA